MQVIVLHLRIGGQAVVDGVGKSGIIIDDLVLGDQDGGQGGRHIDSQNDIFQCLGGNTGLIVLQRLLAVFEDGIQAHAADGHAQSHVVTEFLTAGGHVRLEKLGVGIAHARPHIAGGCSGDDIQIQEGVKRRPRNEEGLEKTPVRMIHDTDTGAARAV